MGASSVEKTYELVVYVAQRFQAAPRFSATKLWKILFWADFDHYRATGQSITRRDYIKLAYGPVPEGYEGLLTTLRWQKAITIESRQVGGHVQKRAVPLREPDLSVFSPDELATINAVIERTWGMSAQDVSDFSHEFLGWQAAQIGERIPYSTAFLRVPELTEAELQRGQELAARFGVTEPE